MRVLLIGASGRTGLLVLTELLSRGHTATCLVRSTSKLSAHSSNPSVTLATGSPTSAADVNRALLSTPDLPFAVIVTLNAPRASDSPFAAPIGSPSLMADASRTLAAAMKAHGVRKLVTMSACGVGSSDAAIGWVLRLMLRRTNMAAQFADHDAVDKGLREVWGEGLDWVLVRPVRLAEGERREVRDLGDLGDGKPGEQGLGLMSKITRESVAGFLVDAAEGEEWNGRSPVIVN